MVEQVKEIDLDQPSNVDRSVKLKFTLSDQEVMVNCVRFSYDDKYLATGCYDGVIRVYNIKTQRLAYVLQSKQAQQSTEEGFPITSIRWRPVGDSIRSKNVLICVNADGSVMHWHVPSGKALSRIYDDTNQLFCIDYNYNGSQFVCAGKDTIVRVFDEETRKLHTKFKNGGVSAPGHSSRVYSIKFVKEDPNMIISGGWDDTLQIWDLREGIPVLQIFGPHISGDSLDVAWEPGVILAGSQRKEDNISIYDLKTQQLIRSVKWDEGANPKTEIYGAQFSKNDRGETFICCGSGGQGSRDGNQAKMFYNLQQSFQYLAGTPDFPAALYSCDYSNDGNLIALGGADGISRVLGLTRKS